MVGMNLAIEIFEAIEGEVGHDRKVEIKDELKTELRDELATKADLANDRAELKGDIADLRAALKGDISSLKMRTTIQFVVTLFVIVLMNPQSLQLIGRMLGLVK
jgi:hypothetical protein